MLVVRMLFFELGTSSFAEKTNIFI